MPEPNDTDLIFFKLYMKFCNDKFQMHAMFRHYLSYACRVDVYRGLPVRIKYAQ
jgi:hypothetical protein